MSEEPQGASSPNQFITRSINCKSKEFSLLIRRTKKKIILEEQRRVEQEQTRLQEELFNEARQKLKIWDDENKASVLSKENYINKSARNMAIMYMTSEKYNGECTYDQTFSVYKILNASEEFIKVKYLSEEKKEQLASTFRQLARVLHPDKNKHPLAREAFLKVSSTYAAVTSS